MKKIQAILAVSLASAAAASQAAVPEAVTTAITTGGTDAVTVGSAVFVAIIGVYAIKMMRKGL